MRAETLVAFEDAGDAEFVASTLKTNLADALARIAAKNNSDSSGSGDGSSGSGVGAGRTGVPPMRLRHTLLSGSPLYLEDLARGQGMALGVVPRDVLSRRDRLSDAALQVG